MANLTPYGDKHARDCSRLWQGSRSGPAFYLRQEPFEMECHCEEAQASSHLGRKITK